VRKLPQGWRVEQDEDGMFSVLDENGDTRGDGETEQEAIDSAGDEDAYTDSPAAPKYGKYTLPGGTNYREVLLTLPERQKGGIPPGYQLIDEAEEARADGLAVPAGETGPWRFRGPSLSSRSYKTREEAMAALLKDAKSEEVNGVGIGSFRSGHWDQSNVLAHIRVNDRTDADGKRVLFVEEIQSDFGQSTKKQRDAVGKAVDNDFMGIVKRMEAAGVLKMECD
jgi:hypothetical protein